MLSRQDSSCSAGSSSGGSTKRKRKRADQASASKPASPESSIKDILNQSSAARILQELPRFNWLEQKILQRNSYQSQTSAASTTASRTTTPLTTTQATPTSNAGSTALTSSATSSNTAKTNGSSGKLVTSSTSPDPSTKSIFSRIVLTTQSTSKTTTTKTQNRITQNTQNSQLTLIKSNNKTQSNVHQNDTSYVPNGKSRHTSQVQNVINGSGKLTPPDPQNTNNCSPTIDGQTKQPWTVNSICKTSSAPENVNLYSSSVYVTSSVRDNSFSNSSRSNQFTSPPALIPIDGYGSSTYSSYNQLNTNIYYEERCTMMNKSAMENNVTSAPSVSDTERFRTGSTGVDLSGIQDETILSAQEDEDTTEENDLTIDLNPPWEPNDGGNADRENLDEKGKPDTRMETTREISPSSVNDDNTCATHTSETPKAATKGEQNKTGRMSPISSASPKLVTINGKQNSDSSGGMEINSSLEIGQTSPLPSMPTLTPISESNYPDTDKTSDEGQTDISNTCVDSLNQNSPPQRMLTESEGIDTGSNAIHASSSILTDYENSDVQNQSTSINSEATEYGVPAKSLTSGCPSSPDIKEELLNSEKNSCENEQSLEMPSPAPKSAPKQNLQCGQNSAVTSEKTIEIEAASQHRGTKSEIKLGKNLNQVEDGESCFSTNTPTKIAPLDLCLKKSENGNHTTPVCRNSRGHPPVQMVLPQIQRQPYTSSIAPGAPVTTHPCSHQMRTSISRPGSFTAAVDYRQLIPFHSNDSDDLLNLKVIPPLVSHGADGIEPLSSSSSLNSHPDVRLASNPSQHHQRQVCNDREMPLLETSDKRLSIYNSVNEVFLSPSLAPKMPHLSFTSQEPTSPSSIQIYPAVSVAVSEPLNTTEEHSSSQSIGYDSGGVDGSPTASGTVGITSPYSHNTADADLEREFQRHFLEFQALERLAERKAHEQYQVAMLRKRKAEVLRVMSLKRARRDQGIKHSTGYHAGSYHQGNLAMTSSSSGKTDMNVSTRFEVEPGIRSIKHARGAHTVCHSDSSVTPGPLDLVTVERRTSPGLDIRSSNLSKDKTSVITSKPDNNINSFVIKSEAETLSTPTTNMAGVSTLNTTVVSSVNHTGVPSIPLNLSATSVQPIGGSIRPDSKQANISRKKTNDSKQPCSLVTNAHGSVIGTSSASNAIPTTALFPSLPDLITKATDCVTFTSASSQDLTKTITKTPQITPMEDTKDIAYSNVNASANVPDTDEEMKYVMPIISTGIVGSTTNLLNNTVVTATETSSLNTTSDSNVSTSHSRSQLTEETYTNPEPNLLLTSVSAVDNVKQTSHLCKNDVYKSKSSNSNDSLKISDDLIGPMTPNSGCFGLERTDEGDFNKYSEHSHENMSVTESNRIMETFKPPAADQEKDAANDTLYIKQDSTAEENDKGSKDTKDLIVEKKKTDVPRREDCKEEKYDSTDDNATDLDDNADRKLTPDENMMNISEDETSAAARFIEETMAIETEATAYAEDIAKCYENNETHSKEAVDISDEDMGVSGNIKIETATSLIISDTNETIENDMIEPEELEMPVLESTLNVETQLKDVPATRNTELLLGESHLELKSTSHSSNEESTIDAQPVVGSETTTCSVTTSLSTVINTDINLSKLQSPASLVNCSLTPIAAHQNASISLPLDLIPNRKEGVTSAYHKRDVAVLESPYSKTVSREGSEKCSSSNGPELVLSEPQPAHAQKPFQSDSNAIHLATDEYKQLHLTSRRPPSLPARLEIFNNSCSSQNTIFTSESLVCIASRPHSSSNMLNSNNNSRVVMATSRENINRDQVSTHSYLSTSQQQSTTATETKEKPPHTGDCQIHDKPGPIPRRTPVTPTEQSYDSFTEHPRDLSCPSPSKQARKSIDHTTTYSQSSPREKGDVKTTNVGSKRSAFTALDRKLDPKIVAMHHTPLQSRQDFMSVSGLARLESMSSSVTNSLKYSHGPAQAPRFHFPPHNQIIQQSVSASTLTSNPTTRMSSPMIKQSQPPHSLSLTPSCKRLPDGFDKERDRPGGFLTNRHRLPYYDGSLRATGALDVGRVSEAIHEHTMGSTVVPHKDQSRSVAHPDAQQRIHPPYSTKAPASDVTSALPPSQSHQDALVSAGGNISRVTYGAWTGGATNPENFKGKMYPARPTPLVPSARWNGIPRGDVDIHHPHHQHLSPPVTGTAMDKHQRTRSIRELGSPAYNQHVPPESNIKPKDNHQTLTPQVGLPGVPPPHLPAAAQPLGTGIPNSVYANRPGVNDFNRRGSSSEEQMLHDIEQQKYRMEDYMRFHAQRHPQQPLPYYHPHHPQNVMHKQQQHPLHQHYVHPSLSPRESATRIPPPHHLPMHQIPRERHPPPPQHQKSMMGAPSQQQQPTHRHGRIHGPGVNHTFPLPHGADHPRSPIYPPGLSPNSTVTTQGRFQPGHPGQVHTNSSDVHNAQQRQLKKHTGVDPQASSHPLPPPPHPILSHHNHHHQQQAQLMTHPSQSHQHQQRLYPGHPGPPQHYYPPREQPQPSFTSNNCSGPSVKGPPTSLPSPSAHNTPTAHAHGVDTPPSSSGRNYTPTAAPYAMDPHTGYRRNIPSTSTDATLPKKPNKHPHVQQKHPPHHTPHHSHYQHTPTQQQHPHRGSPSNSMCEVCGKLAVFLCSSCRRVWYCNQQCQSKHWAVHASECKAASVAK